MDGHAEAVSKLELYSSVPSTSWPASALLYNTFLVVYVFLGVELLLFTF